MRCPDCGVQVSDDRFLCPECGAALDHEKPAQRAKSGGGCRRLLPLLWAALALVLALGFLALAAWQGATAGRKQWRANAQATADAYYESGLNYNAEEKWFLAAAACREADSLKPGYPGAAQCYATAVTALTPTPTPTVIVVQRTVEDVWSEAQERFEAQDWHGTLDLLNELWRMDAEYEAEQVNSMRHTALLAYGRQALDDGWLEEAIYYLDQAAELGPLDPGLEAERQLAARYVSALNFCGVDWQECTTRLTALYSSNPGYRDVFGQLLNAYLQWAEAMVNIQEWCPAETQYGTLQQYSPSDSTEARRAEAAQNCLLATPAPVPGQITGTVTVTVPGFNVGRLAYSAYNGDLGIYELYVLSAYDQSLSKWAGSAGQPDWQQDGSSLAYRGAGGLQAFSGGGSITLLADQAAFWPTLSPDGARIAYARQEADGWRIYVAPTDGSSEPQALTLGKYPTWGPSVLAFSGCIVDGAARGVCVIDPNDPAALPVPLTANPHDSPISWSPDGGNIAYMSDHGGDWDVFLVNTSSGVVLLTADDEAPASDGLPAWAPDGSAIAFISNRGGSWGLYLMSPDGSNVRKALDIGALHPNWLIERLAWGP
jgi:hypothetical protein